ncbi:hypothetical protein O181_035257 [Austropuccinia psidii MF-1]|uniref:C2H2-type domain-containing protein n=1 Tax=Austropuccinia psidii MF-1 TaxID=1389203 RepID=A0A9Q3D8A2_9BASI|nr:hypothetical protein [Austropuccinia psidii MF-1]
MEKRSVLVFEIFDLEKFGLWNITNLRVWYFFELHSIYVPISPWVRKAKPQINRGLRSLRLKTVKRNFKLFPPEFLISLNHLQFSLAMADINQSSVTHPYTCLSCALAFTTAQTQRAHYTTDLHRYNSKRAVAGLPPVDINTFNEKINEKITIQTINQIGNQNTLKCDPCGKLFASEGAQRSHLVSKKHKDIVQRQNKAKSLELSDESNPSNCTTQLENSPRTHLSKRLQSLDTMNAQSSNQDHKMQVDALSKSQKLAALDLLTQARFKDAPQISSNQCLFCPRVQSVSFPDIDSTLSHMLLHHGFFLPDQEYLVDREGLLNYLAEMISVWNVCIYCGTGFGGKIQSDDQPESQGESAKKGLERVRKHMYDKNHCKLPWDTENQRLEFSDFFDYRPSYNNIKTSSKKSLQASKNLKIIQAEDEWEDTDSSDLEKETSHSMETDSDEELPQIALGDSPFELVLPNGTRIGHRALRYIYRQNLLPYAIGSQSTQAGNKNINLITRLAVLSIQDKASSEHQVAINQLSAPTKQSLVNAALVPSRGGGLNFNQIIGTPEVIKARNRGEAREAGKHIRTFKEASRREQFKTRVGCTSGNNQKHYRDPLLQ